MWAGLGAARAILVEAVWGEREDEDNQHTTVTEWWVRMDGCEEGMVPIFPGKPHPLQPGAWSALVALPMLTVGLSGHHLQPQTPVPKTPVLVPSAVTDHRLWLNLALNP